MGLKQNEQRGNDKKYDSGYAVGKSDMIFWAMIRLWNSLCEQNLLKDGKQRREQNQDEEPGRHFYNLDERGECSTPRKELGWGTGGRAQLAGGLGVKFREESRMTSSLLGKNRLHCLKLSKCLHLCGR